MHGDRQATIDSQSRMQKIYLFITYMMLVPRGKQQNITRRIAEMYIVPLWTVIHKTEINTQVTPRH